MGALQSRLLLLSAAVLWSTAGAAMKLCQLSGIQIACGRSFVAGLFLVLAVPEARRRPTRWVWVTAFTYAATVGLFAVSNKMTTAANAIFLQSTAPLWVMLASPRWLGERSTRAELLSVPIYVLGLSLFFVDELSPGQLTGNLVAVAAGLAFASCIVGFRRISMAQAADPTGSAGSAATALVLGNALTALCAFPLWFTGPEPRLTDLWILGYLGVFQLGLAYLCFVRGVAATRALEAHGAPLVFTPGTGVADVDHFFAEATRCCELLDRPGVFLSSQYAGPRTTADGRVVALDYVDLGLLLPYAALLVHHGGIGTTARALQAGIPQLICPHAYDQPDNGARVADLGVGAVVELSSSSGESWATAARGLLASERVAATLRDLASRLSGSSAAARTTDLLLERFS